MTKTHINSPFTPANLYNQVTLDDWRNTAIKALKGAELSALETFSNDQINIHPLYTSVDIPNISALCPKGTETYGVWDIRQRIIVENEKSANKTAISELEGGVNSIEFEFQTDEVDFKTLNIGIKTDLATIGLIAYDNGILFAKKLIEQTPKENLKDALFAFNLNPASLKLMGLDTYSIDEALEFYKENVAIVPKAKFFLSSANWMLEIGASRALQAAILITSGLEWLRAGNEKNIEISKINQALLFKIGIDGQVILEIAKLRAIRSLWAKVTATIGEVLPMDLQAIVSGEMLEDLNPHTNILRISNACFAAATGGANIISTRSFEPDPDKESEFTRRVARNTQIVLANESNIARVNDPAAGSFAFEALTNEIAKSAWEIIQKIESNGGLSSAMKSGLIGEYFNAEHVKTGDDE